ncbi:MAG: isocitrate lyase/PEP mutase family protein, partial [Phenylobacterium sp.]
KDTPGARLRRLLRGQACVPFASVFDPLSARAAAELGYEATFLAGSVAALAVLGAPDMSLLTLSEFAGLAGRISRAGTLPLMVDADHGYGNALNVRRCVEELSWAGVGGMTLEDTALPQPFGQGLAMISAEEALGKLTAALEARPDPDFVVIARTSAYLIEGIDGACTRVAAYAAAGPDGIFVAGLKTRAELAAVRDAAGGLPLVIYATGGEITPEADLASLGVRLLIVGHAPFMSAAAAAHQTLAAQRGLTPASGGTRALVAQLSEDAEHRARAERFLRSGSPQ